MEYIGYLGAFLLGLWLGSVWAYWGFTFAIKQVKADHTKELKELINQLRGRNGISGES